MDKKLEEYFVDIILSNLVFSSNILSIICFIYSVLWYDGWDLRFYSNLGKILICNYFFFSWYIISDILLKKTAKYLISWCNYSW